MNKDYEGALDGHNDIYFKYKIHYDGDPADFWYGWYETPVNSIELTQQKNCDYRIINHSTRNFTILIEMWEEDAMSDDFVADSYWQNCISIAQDELGNLIPTVTRKIGDKHYLYFQGPYSPDVYRYWELRDGEINSDDCDQVQIEWAATNIY
jgi:hypothetical protein